MRKQKLSDFRSSTAGFTLLEIIAVIVIIGVLFAIAAPNWVAFINQQRVSSARNQVSQAIRTAQSEAKRTKLRQAIVFQNRAGEPPRYAIVANPKDNAAIDRTKITNWTNLGDGSSLKLSVNQGDAASPPALMFDNYGSVVTSSTLEPITIPYTVTIGTTLSTNPRRCLKVTSLLGATIEQENSDCSS